MTQVLVTGGAGFIGANLAKRLLSEGHEVVVLDDLSTGSRSNLAGLDIDFREGSVLDISLLREAASGVSAIVHLAAIPSVPRSVVAPVPSHVVNTTGTINVLEAAREMGAHVTTASSSSVYGANEGLPKREVMVPRPRSPYAVSKLAAESYTIAWGLTYGLPSLAFRFFNVYGPLQAAGHAYAAVVPAFVNAALTGRPLPVHGDGTQTRDFTYVDSVTQLLARAALERVTCDSPVNLAFGSRLSLQDVILELQTQLGDIEVEYLPTRPGDVRDSQASNDLLLDLFPGAVATPFPEGLAATIRWMRSVR